MKFVLYLTLPVLLFSSCTNWKSKFEEVQGKYTDMETEYNALKSEKELMSGEYSTAIETLNSIEDTLRSISQREARMRKLTADLESSGASQRDKIISQIAALQSANKSSAGAAASLNSKLKSLQVENTQIKNLMAATEEKLAAKERELAEANSLIESLRTNVNKLESQVLEKSGELAKAYEDLKTQNQNLEKTVSDLQNRDKFISDCAKAYVVCGTKKALRQNGVLRKLNTNLDPDYKSAVKKLNNTVNFYETDVIPCSEGTIQKVLPERPASSYEVVNGSTLKIKDFKTFWATDKTVVILVKD